MFILPLRKKRSAKIENTQCCREMAHFWTEKLLWGFEILCYLLGRKDAKVQHTQKNVTLQKEYVSVLKRKILWGCEIFVTF